MHLFCLWKLPITICLKRKKEKKKKRKKEKRKKKKRKKETKPKKAKKSQTKMTEKNTNQSLGGWRGAEPKIHQKTSQNPDE